MAIGESIYTELTGDADVSALVSTRVYPLIAPQNVTVPYLVYQRVSGSPVNEMAGYAGLENPRYQIDVYDDDYAGARALAVKVRTAMNAATVFTALQQSDTDLYEAEASLFRVTMDFSIWTT